MNPFAQAEDFLELDGEFCAGSAVPTQSLASVVLALAAVRWWTSSSGVSSSFGAVNSWSDQIVGEAVSQTSTARPSIAPSDPVWAGLPSLSFSGSQFLQNLASSSAPHWDGTNTPRTSYSVMRRSTASDASGLEVAWAYGGMSNTAQYGVGSRGTTQNNPSVEIGAGNVNASSFSLGTAPYVQTTTTDSGGLNSIWINGTLALSGAALAPPAGSSLQVFNIGARRFSGADQLPWKGEIQEVIFFDGVHSAAQRASVEGAIRKKYGF